MDKYIELKKSSFRETPWRSPIAISDAVKDIILNKVVCDMGCGEGDNAVFFSRYAKKVIGMDNDRDRYSIAISRGFDVTVGDYLIDDIPIADVYYNWGYVNHITQPKLLARIKSINKNATIIFARDIFLPHERNGINELINKWNGKIRKVEYDEGDLERQKGTMLLLIFNE